LQSLKIEKQHSLVQPAGGQISTGQEALAGEHLYTQWHPTSYDEVVLSTIQNKNTIHHH